MDITKFGQPRGNTLADSDNVAKFSECGPADSCLDSWAGTVDGGATFTGVIVTIDGTDTTFTFDAAVDQDDAPALEAALEQAAQDAGEINRYVSVSLDGTDMIVDHVGGHTFKTLVASDSDKTFTRYCTVIQECDYEANVGDTLTALSFGGSTDALTNTPYSNFNAADATSLKADIESSATSLSLYNREVSVSVGADGASYDVVIKAEGGSEIEITGDDGAEFTTDTCRASFKRA